MTDHELHAVQGAVYQLDCGQPGPGIYGPEQYGNLDGPDWRTGKATP